MPSRPRNPRARRSGMLSRPDPGNPAPAGRIRRNQHQLVVFILMGHVRSASIFVRTDGHAGRGPAVRPPLPPRWALSLVGANARQSTISSAHAPAAFACSLRRAADASLVSVELEDIESIDASVFDAV